MNDLSIKEAMERLHVSKTTIRRLIKRGDLPSAYFQDQKRWVIPQRDIDAYLQRQHQAPAPENLPVSEPDLSPPANLSDPSPDQKTSERPQPVVTSATPAPEQASAMEEASAAEPAPPMHSSPRPGTRSADESRTMIPIIAQPIDELEPSPVPAADAQSAPVDQQTPVPYQSGTIQPSRAHEQSFKWILVQTGIISTNWLEKLFKQIRTALERYKTKTFPETSEPENKHQ